MAVSKKGKRRITVNGSKYLWWVYEEYDQTAFDGYQVKILSENQSIYFLYGFEHNSKNRFVIMALNQNRLGVHLLCPKFEDESGIIKPSAIKGIIEWCLTYPGQNSVRNIIYAFNSKTGMVNENERRSTLVSILDCL